MKKAIITHNVTLEELGTILAAETMAKKITVVLNTTPTMRKTDNPFFGLVKKLTKYQVMINFIYENSVNNQLKRENANPEKFVAGERPWGEHVTKAIINKGDQLYLQLKHERTLHESFVNQSDSTFVDKSDLMPFLQISKPAANQGLEKSIRVISPKFENIVEIAMNGARYRVKR